jgi:hypothetical protein
MKMLEIRAKNVRVNDKVDGKKVTDIVLCGPFTECSRDKIHVTVEGSSGTKQTGCYDREAILSVVRF